MDKYFKKYNAVLTAPIGELKKTKKPAKDFEFDFSKYKNSFMKVRKVSYKINFD